MLSSKTSDWRLPVLNVKGVPLMKQCGRMVERIHRVSVFSKEWLCIGSKTRGIAGNPCNINMQLP